MQSAQIPPTFETRLTSFANLFTQKIGDQTITSIEIPLIQRDYAQGRNTPQVERIRLQFIAAVCSALLPGAAPIELDFVYGDADPQGKFMPLDGQQRLTLLFLLHCYVAWRAEVDAATQPWSKFSYATRPGAREYCAFLVKARPDFSGAVSSWLKDQADYLPTWDFDPTIQSMLVVLDALQGWFPDAFDFASGWQRLIDPDYPAIRFHVLPMADNGMTDAQYIKMNSRGKPLTPFENFKAHFEEMLKNVHPSKAESIARKLDIDWTDILWPYRGDDQLIDDEFMRYFRFLCEVCAWTSGIALPAGDRMDELAYLSELADKVFGVANPQAGSNLAFLCQAFDMWQGKDIRQDFESILTAHSGQAADRLLLDNPFPEEGVDLFHACCRHYGSREWDLAHTLLFYGVLLRYGLPRQNDEVDNFAKRLRVVRNLIEASRGDEIRAGERNNMPALLADIRTVILQGAIDKVAAFNQGQRQNELDKGVLLKATPSLEAILHELEDHDFLLGGLTTFDLDPAHFELRARTFLSLFDKGSNPGQTPWLDVTGALLARGDYARKWQRGPFYIQADFGAPRNKEPWQTLFRGKGRGQSPDRLRVPLMALLDDVASGSTLQDVVSLYLNTSNTQFDWRYYLVKYQVMRTGASGRYIFSKDGYESCMLSYPQVNSYYSDGYLYALTEAIGLGPDDVADEGWPKVFYGYENQERWLTLKIGLRLRSVAEGWDVAEIPQAFLQSNAWQSATQALQADPANRGLTISITGTEARISIPQRIGIDLVDRIQIAANLLKALPDL